MSLEATDDLVQMPKRQDKAHDKAHDKDLAKHFCGEFILATICFTRLF